MLLSAENITKAYGTRVLLDGADLYLNTGEKLGVIGVNGVLEAVVAAVLTLALGRPLVKAFSRPS